MKKNWLVEHQQLLSTQIWQNKLPHALLINGVAGAGKRELSQWLIEVLACKIQSAPNEDGVYQPCKQCKNCLLLQSKTYPDHLIVNAQARSISVDEIRLANQFFEKTAQIGNFKTVIIPNAEIMTVSAANALLKTLEEPSDDSVIILLSDEVDVLLPTIISRCRMISLRPPVGNALASDLGEQLNDPFVNLTHLAEITNEDAKVAYEQFSQTFIQYLETGQLRAELFKQITDSDYSLRWLEKIMANLIRAKSGWHTNDKDELSIKVANYTLEQLLSINKFIVSCRRTIKCFNQANKAFEFEKLLIDINNIVKK